MSANNEHCKIRSFFIDLNPDELKCYLFMVTLDKCNGSRNTFSKISYRICVPNEIENVNLNVLIW